MATDKKDTRTTDLLAWEAPKVTKGFADDVAGKGPLDNRIARVIARALRDVRDDRGLSREDIASAMTKRLRRRVTVEQINKWTSEASDAHRIPLDAFIALIHEAEVDDLIGFIAAERGLAVMPSKYVPIIELHMLSEHEEDIAARRQALKLKLKGV